MNAKEFNESISKIAVDAETKQGMLEVITITNASNMETLLNEFRIMNADFKAELKAIREKSDSEFKRIEEKSSSEFKRIEEKSSSEFKRIEEKSSSEFKRIEEKSSSEFKRIEEKSDSGFKMMNSELKRIEDKIDTKTTLIMSFIGFLIVLMVALKFIH